MILTRNVNKQRDNFLPRYVPADNPDWGTSSDSASSRDPSPSDDASGAGSATLDLSWDDGATLEAAETIKNRKDSILAKFDEAEEQKTPEEKLKKLKNARIFKTIKGEMVAIMRDERVQLSERENARKLLKEMEAQLKFYTLKWTDENEQIKRAPAGAVTRSASISANPKGWGARMTHAATSAVTRWWKGSSEAPGTDDRDGSLRTRGTSLGDPVKIAPRPAARDDGDTFGLDVDLDAPLVDSSDVSVGFSTSVPPPAPPRASALDPVSESVHELPIPRADRESELKAVPELQPAPRSPRDAVPEPNVEFDFDDTPFNETEDVQRMRVFINDYLDKYDAIDPRNQPGRNEGVQDALALAQKQLDRLRKYGVDVKKRKGGKVLFGTITTPTVARNYIARLNDEYSTGDSASVPEPTLASRIEARRRKPKNPDPKKPKNPDPKKSKKPYPKSAAKSTTGILEEAREEAAEARKRAEEKAAEARKRAEEKAAEGKKKAKKATEAKKKAAKKKAEKARRAAEKEEALLAMEQARDEMAENTMDSYIEAAVAIVLAKRGKFNEFSEVGRNAVEQLRMAKVKGQERGMSTQEVRDYLRSVIDDDYFNGKILSGPKNQAMRRVWNVVVMDERGDVTL
jgi:hypothetical protein